MSVLEALLSHFRNLATDEVYFRKTIEFFEDTHEPFISYNPDTMTGIYFESNDDGGKELSFSFYDDDIKRLENAYIEGLPIGEHRADHKEHVLTSLISTISSLAGKTDSRRYLRKKLIKLSKFLNGYHAKTNIRNRTYSINSKYNRAIKKVHEGLVYEKFLKGKLNDWVVLFDHSELPKHKKLQWIDKSSKVSSTTNRATLIFLFGKLTEHMGIKYQHGNKIIESCFLDQKGENMNNIRESKFDLVHDNGKSNPRFKVIEKIVSNSFKF